MSLHVPAETRNVMLSAIAALIDNGGGPGRIQLISADRRVLAVLTFSRPVAVNIERGILTLGPAVDPSARATGKAVAASIEDGDGGQVLACDVSDLKGDAVIRLNTAEIVAGSAVRINTFTFEMGQQ